LASGTIIYVKAGAAGANNGTSWANAYKSLQTALSAATSGKQIWVAKGTYKPGATRGASFTLPDGVGIYGGFAGTETLLSQRKPGVNITILSGEIGAAGSADNSYHVVVGSGAGYLTVLDGFTIKGGNANGATFPDYFGGGMYIENGKPKLNNLVFSGNHADTAGGGIYDHTSGNPTLTHVVFDGNTSSDIGGGMGGYLSSPALSDVVFNNNTATNKGGGMYNHTGNPTLTDVTFSGNSAGSNFGGGMFNYNSSPTLTNATFNGNSAFYGGGLYSEGGGVPALANVTFNANTATYGGALENFGVNPTLTNVTVSGNTAANGGGMYDGSGASPTVHNTIFWGNSTEIVNAASTATLQDSIVAGGCPASSTCTNVVHVSPKLGSLKNNGGLTKTMALGAGSPAIDKGGVVASCWATDQRGVSRPQGGKCDMGAYEVKVLAFQSVGANDGWVLESGENTGVGGSLYAATTTFRVGDDASNKQYRGLLSFNTASLPDAASVVLAQVKVKQQGLVGTSPFTTHGKLTLDLKKPFFGPAVGLQLSDFQAASTKSPAGSIGSMLVSGWYSGLLNSASLGSVNKTGTTQLRLRFSLDDNNDHGADYLSLFSGNAPVSSRPVLIVYYNP
jgi:predicted outer membrane repeat protein